MAEAPSGESPAAPKPAPADMSFWDPRLYAQKPPAADAEAPTTSTSHLAPISPADAPAPPSPSPATPSPSPVTPSASPAASPAPSSPSAPFSAPPAASVASPKGSGPRSAKFTVMKPVTVLDSKEDSKFVAYRFNLCVTHQSGNVVNTVLTKRYSNFIELQQQLERAFPMIRLPELPPKRLFSTSDDVIEERCQRLEIYLNTLLRIDPIFRSSQLGNFLASSLVIKHKPDAPRTASPKAAGSVAPASSASPAVVAAAPQPAVAPLAQQPAAAEQPNRTDASAPPVPPPRATVPSLGTATALFDFSAGADTELSLKAGEVVQLRSTEDASWWYGKRGDSSGYFPANYVRKNP